MMSLDTIRSESRKAAALASAKHLTPYMVRDGDIEDWKAGCGLPLPFPIIGQFVPDGWLMLQEFMVDHSGYGTPQETALTIDQLFDQLRVDFGYAISEVGQFQLYVIEFRRR